VCSHAERLVLAWFFCASCAGLTGARGFHSYFWRIRKCGGQSRRICLATKQFSGTRPLKISDKPVTIMIFGTRTKGDLACFFDARTRGNKGFIDLWIIVPLTFCPCAPVSADSTSASEWRSQILAQSVMSRSKPLRAKSWQRAWRTKPWMKRLFGRICDPLTASHGVAAWISSLQDNGA